MIGLGGTGHGDALRACAGRRVAAVPPRHISQLCSGCGMWSRKASPSAPHCLPGLRGEPAARPQRGKEHRAAWGSAFGEGLGYWPRSAEHLSGG